MRRLPHLLTAAALSASGLAMLATAAPQAQAATAGTRLTMIGDKPLKSLMDSNKPVRDIITATYPVSIDGTACRGSVRSSCQDAPPAAGLPSSAYEVVKANTGQMGDVVVLMTGYSDLIASPNTNPPDMTPFNKDFTTLVTELQNQPGVQHVVMLNLRTSDTRIPALQINKYNAINSRLDTYDADNATFPKLSVANWRDYSASLTSQCNGGTDDGCFQTDGISPRSGANPDGATQLAFFIRDTVNALSASPGAGVPPAVGSRCTPSNGTGFAPYTYVPLETTPNLYPPQPAGPQAPDPGSFVSISPARVFDSRATRPVAANQLLRIQVTDDAWNVPPSATAVALNVTAVGPCGGVGPGYLTVFPCGPTGAPNASNVNYQAFTNVANAVTVRVGTLGRVCVFSSHQTDVIVDVNGYYAASGAGHAGATPLRVTDTRTGTAYDAKNTAVTAGSIHSVTLPVADGTTGATLNVTALAPAGTGFLTVFPGPCGAGNLPLVSNVNYSAGQVVPNYVAVKVPGTKQICVYSSATTNLLIDLTGTFAGSGTTLKALQPQRLLDTRAGSQVQPFVPVQLNVITAATPDLPGNAQGVLLNVTSVGPAGTGYVTVYPCGTTPPNASNLNFVAGDVRPNLVDATIGTGSSVCMVSSVATHLLVDLTGYYSA